ncbi:MAG: GNAT family acetyltransferase [Firmicutes bacterium]|nr:GNAT family acetyltransferase [Bacillota bacterium]
METFARMATIKDIPELMELQKLFHVDTISPEDKKDGFVTTKLTEEQWKELIEKENGVTILTDDEKVLGYALAASWEYWSSWPLFEYMIERLHEDNYKGEIMSVENSYQYGPICIVKELRGTDALNKLFFTSLKEMNKRYKYLLTFVNQINPRSYAAHTRKLGLDVIKEFGFNNNKYWELGTTTDRWSEIDV